MKENKSIEKKDSHDCLSSKFFMYKGKPLVRCGNIIYYGDMDSDYVAMLQILDSDDSEGFKTSKNIKVQLMSTDTTLSPKDMVVKNTEKVGLYNAIDIADVWLSRALANSK